MVDPKPNARNSVSDDGVQVLDDVDAFLGAYVIYPGEPMRHAHVLWCAHTHLMDCWESTPRIFFSSPEPGSGKTRALEVSEPLVPRPVHAVNVTPAYLFRKISDADGLPTILYDEIDTVFGPKAKEHEDIRAVINSGHRKGATAGRCVVSGNDVKTVDLPSYCAVAMAGLHDLPDTIMSRSIVVRMKKRASGSEKVKPWRFRRDVPVGEQLGVRLGAWAKRNRERALQHWPQMPDGIEDRNADAWEALVAVADLAGGHWPERARVAAVADVADKSDEGESMGVLLLSDIHSIFSAKNSDRLRTATLLTNLVEVDESPWSCIRRDRTPIDARGLAQRLKSYGIRSKDIRWSDGKVSKGYERADFVDAWERYVKQPATEHLSATLSATSAAVPSSDFAATCATRATPQVNGHLYEADRGVVADRGALRKQSTVAKIRGRKKK